MVKVRYYSVHKAKLHNALSDHGRGHGTCTEPISVHSSCALLVTFFVVTDFLWKLKSKCSVEPV